LITSQVAEQFPSSAAHRGTVGAPRDDSAHIDTPKTRQSSELGRQVAFPSWLWAPLHRRLYRGEPGHQRRSGLGLCAALGKLL